MTLVTVTYNSERALKTFWADYNPRWGQWIVVDNASSDGSADLARSLGALVIELDENIGFSAANNIGTSASNGAVLIFCNPDVEVDESGIRKLSRQAISTPCLVAPQLLNQDGSLQENGRGVPYPHRKVRHMLLKDRSQNDSYSLLNESDGLMTVPWAMGAAVALSRTTFARVGGWNDSYFIYYEDAELCLRALQLGVPTYIDGGVRWRHGWARATARGFSRNAWRHELRSGVRFYMTHPHLLIPVGHKARLLRKVDGIGRLGNRSILSGDGIGSEDD